MSLQEVHEACQAASPHEAQQAHEAQQTYEARQAHDGPLASRMASLTMSL